MPLCQRAGDFNGKGAENCNFVTFGDAKTGAIIHIYIVVKKIARQQGRRLELQAQPIREATGRTPRKAPPPSPAMRSATCIVVGPARTAEFRSFSPASLPTSKVKRREEKREGDLLRREGVVK